MTEAKTQNGKVPKFCDGCGKPLFKYWVQRLDDSCIIVKIDVGCKREPCMENNTANKTVELKFDINFLKSLQQEQVAV